MPLRFSTQIPRHNSLNWSAARPKRFSSVCRLAQPVNLEIVPSLWELKFEVWNEESHGDDKKHCLGGSMFFPWSSLRKVERVFCPQLMQEMSKVRMFSVMPEQFSTLNFPVQLSNLSWASGCNLQIQIYAYLALGTCSMCICVGGWQFGKVPERHVCRRQHNFQSWRSVETCQKVLKANINQW